jgi:hypothetical protein
VDKANVVITGSRASLGAMPGFILVPNYTPDPVSPDTNRRPAALPLRAA